jgi:hypothetical protein
VNFVEALRSLEQNDNFLYKITGHRMTFKLWMLPMLSFFAFLYQGQEFPSGKLLPGKLIPFGHTPFGNIEKPTPLGDWLEGI